MKSPKNYQSGFLLISLLITIAIISIIIFVRRGDGKGESQNSIEQAHSEIQRAEDAKKMMEQHSNPSN